MRMLVTTRGEAVYPYTSVDSWATARILLMRNSYQFGRRDAGRGSIDGPDAGERARSSRRPQPAIRTRNHAFCTFPELRVSAPVDFLGTKQRVTSHHPYRKREPDS